MSRRAELLTLVNVIAGLLGAAAFAASFAHVRRLAAEHGQRGWIAWAIAATIELMAIAGITDMQKRRAAGRPVAAPVLALLGGIGMSLAANLATASPGGWGHIMAAWPAVAFLSVAGLVESRSDGPAAVPADVEPPQRQTEDEGPSRARSGGSHGRSRGRGKARRRPERIDVVAQLVSEMQETGPTWRPNYSWLMAETGYSRTWCERRVAEAREALREREVEALFGDASEQQVQRLVTETEVGPYAG